MQSSLTPGTSPAICIIPNVQGVGGMVSFRHKLEQGLAARNIRVSSDPTEYDYQALLVIGGTRRFIDLRHARRRGIPVIQRLDGMNWLHRFSWRRRLTGWSLRHYLRAEYGNLVLHLIRSRLATQIVYQSEFVRRWWERMRGPSDLPQTIIHNGVNLDTYTPEGPETLPEDCWRILLVEGSLMGGYEGGLETAVQLVDRLSAAGFSSSTPFELQVAGRVSSGLKAQIEAMLSHRAPLVRMVWSGVVSPDSIPSLDRSAHLLFSADINAACPNSAIEAMACGLPVIGFATGALPELVPQIAGRLVDYGGDPWKLDPPDVAGLARAALDVLDAGESLRRSARLHAQTEFGLDGMVDRYLDALFGSAA